MPRPCGECRGQMLRAKLWAEAEGEDLLDLCESVGVGKRFCQGGVPPQFSDSGLAERLLKRSLPEGGLLIVGPVGAHKTHLVTARTVDAARRGLKARRLKWSRFCLEVRDTFKVSARDSEQDVLNRYADLDYLAIDDLCIGREDRSESGASVRLAYELFDARYESCKLTDITTNCLPEELAQRFDDRIYRRITELTTVYPMLLTT